MSDDMSDEERQPSFEDATIALFDALDIDIAAAIDDDDHIMSRDGSMLTGVFAFAKQLDQVMRDIAQLHEDDPQMGVSTSLFAIAGMVSDVFTVACAAGHCAPSDIPPHPMRNRIEIFGNRQQRRAEERELRRRGRGPQLGPPR